jgi:hypothetical protein
LCLLAGRVAGQIAPAADVWERLALLAGGWLAAACVIRESLALQSQNGARRRVAPVATAIGLSGTVFLAAMSPDVVLGVAAIAPVLAATTTLLIGSTRPVSIAELHQALASPSSSEPQAITDSETPSPSEAMQAAPSLSAANSAEAAESEMADEEEASEVWQAVQREFVSDVGLMRNVTSWTTADGNETIVANLRCSIPHGARSAVAHVPFWPFLHSAPEVWCRQIDGPDAEIEVTESRPNGVAVELTLKNGSPPADNTAVVIEVIAVGAPAGSSSSAA